jgi:hypothetical protein
MGGIREVAEQSGVSVATVSRVFNGYTDVSPATRQRVLDTARELDYTPSAAARTLVKRRSELIGVVLFTGVEHPDIGHPFFQEVLVGLKHGWGRRDTTSSSSRASSRTRAGTASIRTSDAPGITASTGSCSWASTATTRRSRGCLSRRFR